MQSDKSDKNGCFAITKKLGYDVVSVVKVKNEKTGLNTTQRGKKRFLAIFEQIGGLSVSRAAGLARISRDTYYRWLREDDNFREKINSIQEHLNVYIEGLFMEKIAEGDGASMRFYLSRRHPSYMDVKMCPSQTKTLEDLLDEDEAKSV